MTRVDQLKVGDKIMPPAREVRLWMRRALLERNLPEAALTLTVTNITEGTPDKRGRWLLVATEQTPEWNEGRKALPFKFKARPETPWLTVEN
jgi:hypothetical protein